MTNRGQFSQLLAAGLQVLSMDELAEHDEEYSSFLDVGTSTSAFEEDQLLAGLGTVVLKPEGSPITYDDPIQGGSVRYIHDTYALGWLCTAEMMADDKYGKIKQVPKELMPSLKYVVEQVGANVLNNGFTSVKTADGVSLFNTAHPLLGGGTQSNQLSNNSDLSATGVQDMIILAENFVNQRGQKRHIKPTDIWYPAELRWIAQTIFKSEFQPGTGNNDINTVQGILEPHTLHFLTSTTAWFVSSKTVNHARFLWRKKVTMDAADDFDTKGSKHSVDARFSAGASDYTGWFGSTGLGA